MSSSFPDILQPAAKPPSSLWVLPGFSGPLIMSTRRTNISPACDVLSVSVRFNQKTPVLVLLHQKFNLELFCLTSCFFGNLLITANMTWASTVPSSSPLAAVIMKCEMLNSNSRTRAKSSYLGYLRLLGWGKTHHKASSISAFWKP